VSLLFDSSLHYCDLAIRTKGTADVYVDFRMKEFDAPMEEIRYYRGLSYLYLKQFENAIKDFDFCISKKFDLSDVYFNRGLAYGSDSFINQACMDLKKAKELGNQDASKYITEYCK